MGPQFNLPQRVLERQLNGSHLHFRRITLAALKMAGCKGKQGSYGCTVHGEEGYFKDGRHLLHLMWIRKRLYLPGEVFENTEGEAKS